MLAVAVTGQVIHRCLDRESDSVWTERTHSKSMDSDGSEKQNHIQVNKGKISLDKNSGDEMIFTYFFFSFLEMIFYSTQPENMEEKAPVHTCLFILKSCVFILCTYCMHDVEMYTSGNSTTPDCKRKNKEK